MPIHFFSEDVAFVLQNASRVQQWLTAILHSHGFKLKSLNYIFCSDEYLLDVNKKYLNHDFYTDIITFDHSEVTKVIEGDIFVSIDRVKENASGISVDFYEELHRVMAHGLLHLLGYEDAKDEEKMRMREKENACLSLLKESGST